MTVPGSGPYVWSMIPDNQVARKRPYVLLPPTAIPSDGESLAGTERTLTGDETLSFQISFREAEHGTPDACAIGSVTTRPMPLSMGLLLYVVLPSALGFVAGFHLAGQWAGDVLTWSTVGGAAGLLLGGGCLLWNRRQG